MTTSRILLVGRRKGAIAAARRCGWEPVVMDVAARREQTPKAFGGTARWAVEEADSLFPDGAPASVTAVATGSVTAAASIRAHLGLPGISPETAMRCHDKLVMKKAIVAAGISCAPWMETDTDTRADKLIDTLGLPVILKLPISSGGRGVWICHSPGEIEARLQPGMLAEGFVKGTEMSVETLRYNRETIFRNHTRYLKPRWANIVPANLDTGTQSEIDRLAESVHVALGIDSGISHMEIFLSDQGPVFGEIAARPPGGYLMDLMSRTYGFDPWEALLRLSMGERPAVSNDRIRFAGVWLIHPGAGTVLSTRGLEEARSVPGIVEIATRLDPGTVLSDRIGSGDSRGRIVAEAATSQACAEALIAANDLLRFEFAP